MDIEFGNGSNMLIRYLTPKVRKERYKTNHPDPMFKELTYGEGCNRANSIRNHIRPGSHVFFHDVIGKDKQLCITAHYFISKKPMEGDDARSDNGILKEYENPHIHPERYGEKPSTGDIIIFGDRNKSLGLVEKPLPFDRNLAKSLTFEGPNKKIEFDKLDKNGIPLSDKACITPATMALRLMNNKVAEFLYHELESKNPKKIHTSP